MSTCRLASQTFRAVRTTRKSIPSRLLDVSLIPASRAFMPTSYASFATKPTSLRASFSTSPPSRHDSSSSSSKPPMPPPTELAEVRSHDFPSMKKLVSSPSPSRVIVDVREPAEVQASGRIPGAVNMPINSAPEGLFLPADEFEDRFGFAKPKADQEVVFYCKAGVRSRAASRVASMAGYQNVAEYPGSWVDWEQNGGEIEK